MNKFKKKSENISELASFAEEVTNISCTRCELYDGQLLGDFVSCLEEFYGMGWRATKKHCYCPNCAKKFNIK